MTAAERKKHLAERDAAMQKLRDAGMTCREIGELPAFNLSESQVSRKTEPRKGEG